MFDDRLKSEMTMVEKMMEYKTNLKDWAYFRTMKLVYQYISMQYASKLPKRVGLTRTALDQSNGTHSEDRQIYGNMEASKTAEAIHTEEGNKKTGTGIWTLWLQGEEQAPAIVRKCLSSLNRLDREVCVLTEDNLSDYSDIPEYILEKRRRGIINNTHFSDIVRAAVLTKHGGTWIDATVYVSDAELISQVLDKYPLFAYSFAMRDTINDYMLFDSWFLHGSRGGAILEDTRDMLYAYWENEDSLMHYFLFHLMFSIACRRHPEEYEAIPVFSLEPCHILQHEMLKPYDELRWDHIMRMSGVHKLTYKYDTSADTKGSMLDHLLGSDI